jgi:hypothetical protein
MPHNSMVQGSLTEMTLRYLQGLLGEARFFKQEFVRPITGGTDKGATERAQSLGAAKAAELRARIGPYFLRREKQHVLRPSSDRCATRSRVLSTKEHRALCRLQARPGDLLVAFSLSANVQTGKKRALSRGINPVQDGIVSVHPRPYTQSPNAASSLLSLVGRCTHDKCHALITAMHRWQLADLLRMYIEEEKEYVNVFGAILFLRLFLEARMTSEESNDINSRLTEFLFRAQ